MLAPGSILTAQAYTLLSRLGRFLPEARALSQKVDCVQNVVYREVGACSLSLDVYRPVDQQGPLPIVLYVHGGGFFCLSKDTHWLMGLAFARRGYVVFNIDYRLAPEHPFPAAMEDVCAAWCWVVREARHFGGDPERIVLAGESAGANLVTGLTLATAYRREEAFAKAVWETAHTPKAVVPACGIYQLSGEDRFRDIDVDRFTRNRLTEVPYYYLPQGDLGASVDFADPVCLLERGEKPERPLPPFFLPVGDRDPLWEDSKRMERALLALETPAEARTYTGQHHAFHAMVWKEAARQCWRDTFEFLDELFLENGA